MSSEVETSQDLTSHRKISRPRQNATPASAFDRLGTPLLKNWRWLAEMEMSRLRFATLDMTTCYVVEVHVCEPIGAAPMIRLEMTRG